MAKNENTTSDIEVKETKVRITFTKEKILKCKRYEDRIDLLGVLLNETKAYTFDEVDALIEKFMKGKVK